jgi:hypothetical protein
MQAWKWIWTMGLAVTAAACLRTHEDICGVVCARVAECGPFVGNHLDGGPSCQQDCITLMQNPSSAREYCDESATMLANCVETRSCEEINSGRCGHSRILVYEDCGLTFR